MKAIIFEKENFEIRTIERVIKVKCNYDGVEIYYLNKLNDGDNILLELFSYGQIIDINIYNEGGDKQE